MSVKLLLQVLRLCSRSCNDSRVALNVDTSRQYRYIATFFLRGGYDGLVERMAMQRVLAAVKFVLLNF